MWHAALINLSKQTGPIVTLVLLHDSLSVRKDTAADVTYDPKKEESVISHELKLG
jgi:hypothetical protein